jgi:hypothetical protein
MLSYQETLGRENQRKNAKNILGVKKIPCGNQMTRLLEAELERFESFRSSRRLPIT